MGQRDHNSKKTNKSLRCFGWLMALSSMAHISVHLPVIELSAVWVSFAAVLILSAWVMWRPTLKSLVTLAVTQCLSVILYTPFNPDHWLLVFFVNLIFLYVVLKLRFQQGKVCENKLMQQAAPAMRMVFLLCYGFAALAKWNTDFLFSEDGAALELLALQVIATPQLAWLVYAPSAPWITVICESSIPLLLLFNRTRVAGILVGLLFHLALIISPAIAVYDFTFTIYTMLYLFTPHDFDERVRIAANNIFQKVPSIRTSLIKWRSGVFAPVIFLIAVSCWGEFFDLPEVLVRGRGAIALAVALFISVVSVSAIVPYLRGSTQIVWMPQQKFAFVVLTVAVLNGLCPYLGLKTQGSFTMFSNLRTEGKDWNHCLMPQAMRVFSVYQDDLVKIVDANDDYMRKTFVERGLLTTRFELTRRVSLNPELVIVIEKDGQELELNKVNYETQVGSAPSSLAQKLLVFRPVSPDGKPFLTN